MPDVTDSILLGGATKSPRLLLRYANRHGLIAGATGTGKTVSLQVLAEGFSRAGVPVFVADVKGDLSGLTQPGKPHPKVDERIERIGITNYKAQGYPVTFWDLFAKKGHSIRTTVSEMGPVMLARLLQLNDTQEGVLNIAFAVADAQGLLLLDLKDLRAMMQHVADNRVELSAEYGNVSTASVGAIQRRLLVLEQQKGKMFFGEPALDIRDFMRTTRGKGNINLLAADELMAYPKLYATFLLWLLSELFEELPEVGDADKPRLVFIFDEAHLLFTDAPKSLLEKVTQVVRLVRSKGVGVYFVTQNPTDIPDEVLGQLGNRVQHALRAFTPRDQKAVRAAAQTFRPNPAFKVESAITELGVGEALVSVLDGRGAPSVVQRTLMCPPESQMGPIPLTVRKQIMEASAMGAKYGGRIDRESAYEMLMKRSKRKRESTRKAAKAAPKKRRSSRRQSTSQAFAKSAARSVGSQLGRGLGKSLVRGLLGSLLK